VFDIPAEPRLTRAEVELLGCRACARLDEAVGQEHLLAPGSPLRRMVEDDSARHFVTTAPW